MKDTHRPIAITADDTKHPLGDRTSCDAATYPDDDLRADFVDGAWRFMRKDGTPY